MAKKSYSKCLKAGVDLNQADLEAIDRYHSLDGMTYLEAVNERIDDVMGERADVQFNVEYYGGEMPKYNYTDQDKPSFSTGKEQAQSDLDDALGDLGDIFNNLGSKGIKEGDLTAADILPVLTRVMDAAIRLGYNSFKEAAAFTLTTITDKFSKEHADAITIDHLQGAYIATGAGETSKRDVVDVETKDDLTVGEPVVAKTLQVVLEDNFKEITDNRKLKNILAAHHEVSYADVSDRQVKEAQELLEIILVQEARMIVEAGGNEKHIYDRLVELYKSQPNLNVRSSTSIENQAYSTPAPIAFLASQLADISQENTTYEPTAGNGMLLIGANKHTSIVNELNDERANALESMGFEVTQNDAATWNPDERYDKVIMNPPFGAIGTPTTYAGYKITAIDHLIAIKALENMEADGNATMIIGASLLEGEISRADQIFFNYLYSHYDVTSHFEIDGKLYARQGASFPIRVVTVNGRVASNKLSPKSGSIKRVSTWGEVYDEYLDARNGRHEGEADLGVGTPTTDEGTVASLYEDQAATPDGQRGLDPDTTDVSGSSGVSGQFDDSGATSGSDGAIGIVSDDYVDAGSKSGTTKQPDKSGVQGTKPTGSDGNVGGKPSSVGSGFQTPYPAQSTGKNEEILTPNNMADPLKSYLSELDARIDGVDGYVMEKLGYDSIDALHKAFMGLQVDSIAAFIDNDERLTKGIIIADQTGVGKGRQAAGIIRYAIKNGKTPIFITEQANLFTDMYSDLHDIGSDNVVPFIMNANGFVKSPKDGSRLFYYGATKRKGMIEDIINDGVLPSGTNALFMTYSQITGQGYKRNVLEALGDDVIFVLDEAHNMAGDQAIKKKITNKETGETAWVNQETGAGHIVNAIDGKSVVYLSATYAKRADNMAAYYRTDLMDAVDTPDQLIDAVNSGGVPLQTVVSNMLSQSGQLFRREKSFAGIEILPEMVNDEDGSIEVMYDNVVNGLRAITRADSAFNNIYFEHMKKTMKEQGGGASMAGNKATKGLDTNNFTSVFHNYISQLLLATKADAVVDKAVALHKAGEKPVIGLENTMGSFIAQYVEDYDVQVGDSMRIDYRDVLLRGLERTRRITQENDRGEKDVTQVSISQLDPITKAAYIEAEELIAGLEIEHLPLSPIDYIRDKLEAEGIKVSELTGREWRIDYSTEDELLYKRDKAESNKRDTVDKFNTGELNALVLNVSGATGLSIHASERKEFTDKKPRHMIIAQPARDINVFMQMLGRINRTGQVVLPRYTLLSTSLPAELRPLSVTLRKLASLNANTSANAKSDVSFDVPDIFNKYGDQVVNDFILENPEIAQALSLDGYGSEEGSPMADLALKFTGRAALLPANQLRKIYETINADYKELIDYLNSVNQNDLEAKTLDTDARILQSVVFYEGKNPQTIFGGNTILHNVDIKSQGKPPTAKDVARTISKTLGEGTAEDVSQKIMDKKAADMSTEDAINKRLDKYKEHHTTAKAALDAYIGEEKGKAKLIREAGHASEALLQGREQLDKYAQHKMSVSHAITQTFTIGSRFNMDFGDGTVKTVVVDLFDTHKKGKGSPYSPSKTKVTFMVNDGIRQVTIPMSKLIGGGLIEGTIYNNGVTEEALAKLMFRPLEEGHQGREDRFIATGNLIMGSAQLESGHIVTFTDQQQTSHTGILLPKNFKVKGGDISILEGNNDIPLRDYSITQTFLKNHKEAIRGLGLFTQKRVVVLEPIGEDWKITVPRANRDKQARDVKLDAVLRRDMGTDFYGSGKFMTARFDSSRLNNVLMRLMDTVQLHVNSSMREKLVASGAKERPTAVKSFVQSRVVDNRIIPEGAIHDHAFIESVRGVKTAGQALQLVIDNPKASQAHKAMAKRLMAIDGVSDVTVNVDDDGKLAVEDHSGEYNNQLDEITLSGFNSDIETLIHEASHAATIYTLAEHIDKDGNALTKTGEDLNTILGFVRNNFEGTRYGLLNVKELIAEAYANPDFIAELKLINQDGSTPKVGKPSLVSSLWRRLINLYRKMIGYPLNTKTAYDAVMEVAAWAERGNAAARQRNSEAWRNAYRKQDMAAIDPSIRDSELAKGIKGAFGKLYSNIKEGSFGALTLRQLADVTSQVMPTIKSKYLQLKNRMDVERNQMLERGGKVATKRGKLSKQESSDLAEIQQEATLAGVDISQDEYSAIFSDKELAIKRNVIRRDMANNPENMSLYDEMLEELNRIEQEEPSRRESYYELKSRYNLLSDAAKTVYIEERDYHTEYLDKKQAELEKWIARTDSPEKVKAKLIQQIKLRYEIARIRSPYFPLSRFGDFWVQSTLDGVKAFDMFESESEQKAFSTEIEADGGVVTGMGKNMGRDSQSDGVPISFVTEVDKLLVEMGDENATDSVRFAVYQLYLQSLPEVSARKHHMRRRKVKGFYADQSRAFATSVVHTAAEISKIMYASDMADVLNDNQAAVKAASSTGIYKRTQNEIDHMNEYLDEAEEMSIEEIDAFIADNSGANNAFKVKWDRFRRFKAEYSRNNIVKKINRNEAVLLTSRKIMKNNAQTFASDAMRELQQSHQALMQLNTHWISQALNSLGFSWFLGLTPAAAMVNMVQTPVVALPLIAAKYGWNRTAKHMARATKDFFHNQDGKRDSQGDTREGFKLTVEASNLTKNEQRAFTFWYDEGLLDNTLSHDTAGIAESGVERGTFKQKTMGVLTFMFHHAERANREVTALAAYRSGVEFYTKGRTNLSDAVVENIHQKAMAEANDLTWDSHLDYTSNNRARFLRGNVMRVVAQFKQYSQGIMYLYVRQMVKAFRHENPEVRAEAKKALLGMVTMQISIAGTLGLPFVGLAIGAMQAMEDVFGDDDDPMDIKAELRQAIADVIGTTGGVAVTKGLVNAFTPLNVHDRLTLDGLFYRGDSRDLEGRDQAYSFLKNILGTQATILVENPLVAVSLASRGNYDRAFETMMPKFIKDALKATRYIREEAKTLGGYHIKDMSLGESLGQFIGFSSSNLSEYYDQGNALTKVENKLKHRRKRLIANKVEADKSGNSLAVQREINAWNMANPNNRITALNIKQSRKARKRFEDNRVEGRTVSKRYQGTKYDYGDF